MTNVKEDVCVQVKIFYQGHYDHTLDVRFLLKVVGEDIDVIKELQLNGNGLFLSASQVDKRMCKLYSFQYCSNVGWKLGTVEQFIHESKDQKPSLTIAFHVNFPTNFVKNLQDSIHSFLKKCQLMMPYLTVVSSMNGKSYRRPGIEGIKKDKDWCNNVSIYLRTCSQTDFSTASKVKYKHVNVEQTAPIQCPSFSVLYGMSSGVSIGMEHHLHVFAFSENGVPLTVDSSVWHRSVLPPSLQNNQSILQPGPCAPMLCDVCYYMDDTGPRTCYFLLLLARDEQHLQLLLTQHSDLVASTLTESLQTMVGTIASYERDKKWSHIIATSVGSLMRFSLDNEFRKECLCLMEATNSLDAELKLKHTLIHQLQQ